MEKINIVIDLEKMRYKHTGLYTFCDSLKDNLIQYGSSFFDFTFFVCKTIVLPENLKTINRSFFKKIVLMPRFKYKIWHTTFQNTKFFPLNFVKIVYTIHDLNFLHEDVPVKKKNKKIKKIQKRIDKAAYVTVISKYVLKELKENLRIDSEKKIKVIYNGVDVKLFPEFHSPKYFPKAKFIFTIGTIMQKKNFHVISSLLIDNDMELIIAGKTISESYRRKIIDVAKDLGVESRVKLLGAITDEEKYWYMKKCIAFVFPSIAEGFGIPPIEAMQLGKPVFLSKYTSLPEIGGDKAFYFDDFDENHMKSVFNTGMRDYELKKMDNEIIQWGTSFSWKKSTEEYLAVYKEVLEEN